MKIIYINHGLTPVEKFLDDAIREAFLKSGAEVELFDFTKQTLIFSELLALAVKDQPRENLLAAAQKYASALIPQSVYETEADYIFFVNGHNINRKVLSILKDLGKRLVTWQIDDPYWIDLSAELSPLCEHIFTVDSSTLEIYQAKGCKKVHFLPLAFPEELNKAVQLDEKHYSDICFIGTPFRDSFRVRLIDELAPFLKKYKVKLIGSHLVTDSWQKSLKNYEDLKNFIIEEFVPQEEAVKYMMGAKVNLNIHRDSFGHPLDRNQAHVAARSPNDRTFLLAGLGAFQLVDDSRPDLEKLFKIGEEIVVFSGAEDLAAKITKALSEESWREAIAAAAKRRALSEHTYQHRIQKIMEILT